MSYRSPQQRRPGLAAGTAGQATWTEARVLRLVQDAGHPQTADAVTLGRVFEASPTATIVTDDRMRLVGANQAFERLSGLGRSEWLGSTPRVEWSHGRPAWRHLDPAWHDLSVPCEVVFHRRDGRRRRVWMSWARVAADGGAGGLRVATFAEPGRWDDEFELWRHRAHHDMLTGLPNREYLLAELQRGLARASRHHHRLAMLFIDLDGFKAINDGFGHAAGDRLLARVSLRLRDALRAEDFVARYGGDEFVVMLEAPRHADDAAATAEAVLGALGHGSGVQGHVESAVTASIGIALFPDHAGDAAGLLQVADAAMYRAKRAGGNAAAIGTAGPASLPLPR